MAVLTVISLASFQQLSNQPPAQQILIFFLIISVGDAEKKEGQFNKGMYTTLLSFGMYTTLLSFSIWIAVVTSANLFFEW